MRLFCSFVFIALFLFGCAAVISDDRQKARFVGNDMKASEEYWKDIRQARLALDERDIPAQIPGPADAAWAGETPKEVILPLPFDRETTLTLSLLDSHESAPPVIAISVDGAEVGRIVTTAGAGVPLVEREKKGKRSSYTLAIPAAQHEGERYVTLSPVEGSWIGVASLTFSPTIAWWEPWRLLSTKQGIALMALACGLALLFWLDDARRERRLGQAFGNLALLGVTVSMTLALGEFILATWYPQPDFSHALWIVYEKDDAAGFRLKPNVRTKLGYDTNRLGMRDFDRYTETKPDDVYRILALGDSLTFSWTSLKDAWPTLLEQGLAADGKRLELLNAGVPGYGTDDEYFYLNAYGEALSPDMVVLGLYVGNDLLENGSDHDYTVVDGTKVKMELAATVEREELTLRKRGLAFASRFHWYRLARRFRLDRMFDTMHAKDALDIRRRMNQPRDSCIRSGDTRFQYAREEWSRPDLTGGMDHDWERTVTWLTRIADWSEAHHARFLIVLIPVELQLDTPEAIDFRARMEEAAAGEVRLDWAEPQKSLIDLASDKQWPVVDLLPAMREAAANERLYYCNDIHMNEAGSQVTARVVGEALATRWPDLSFDPAEAVPVATGE